MIPRHILIGKKGNLKQSSKVCFVSIPKFTVHVRDYSLLSFFFHLYLFFFISLHLFFSLSFLLSFILTFFLSFSLSLFFNSYLLTLLLCCLLCVLGRFKKPISFAHVYTGQAYDTQINHIPAKWLVNTGLQFMSKLQPAHQACLQGNRPHILSPLVSTAQKISTLSLDIIIDTYHILNC